MQLSAEQNRFVAPNVVSLAQAWLYQDEARPLAVCDGDEVVGFLMLDWDENERTVGIWRFMIAPAHQNKGFGRKALQAAIQLAREANCFDLMHLDYIPGNDVARNLYYSLGFRENGDVEDGEIVMTMPLTDSPKIGMLTADEDDFEEIWELVRSEGATIPGLFRKEEALRDAVKKGLVMRFTIMGETVAIAWEDAVLIGKNGLRYADEISERRSGK